MVHGHPRSVGEAGCCCCTSISSISQESVGINVVTLLGVV